jgi:hypothetical protein
MSEVDRLSNSGLYPALPIADKRRGKDESGKPPSGPHPEKPTPQAGDRPDPSSSRPPKSLIDEYA